MTRKEQTMTPQSFKAQLRAQGKTVRQWSEEHGFPATEVYRTLNGINKGNFGRAHDILVAAGIKQKHFQKAA